MKEPEMNPALKEAFDQTGPSGKSSFPSYIVPLDVIRAIRKGRRYTFSDYNNLAPGDFFEIANNLLSALRSRRLDEEMFKFELKALFAANKNALFVKGIKKYHDLEQSSVILLLMLCAALIVWDDSSLPVSKIRRLVDAPVCASLESGEHQLFRFGLVEHDNDRGFSDTENYRLSEQACEELLRDVEYSGKIKDRNIISAESLEKRVLFYPSKIKKRSDELTELLREDRFCRVKKHLTENNMRACFTALFYGPPGTGKTETVYQIARETGRDIMRVDISDTKSQWFGESEKIVKGVFTRYRSLLKKTRESPAPVLLFNEADGVFGKRMKLGDTSRGPAQTENAIQNIILQEMEETLGKDVHFTQVFLS